MRWKYLVIFFVIFIFAAVGIGLAQNKETSRGGRWGMMMSGCPMMANGNEVKMTEMMADCPMMVKGDNTAMARRMEQCPMMMEGNKITMKGMMERCQRMMGDEDRHENK